jgi:hypothetical protein
VDDERLRQGEARRAWRRACGCTPPARPDYPASPVELEKIRAFLSELGAPASGKAAQLLLNAFADGSPKFVFSRHGEPDIVVTPEQTNHVLGHSL